MMRLLLALVGLLLFSFSVNGQASGDYRSFATGNWNAASSWETFNGVSWVAASTAPASTDGTITIQNGHAITVTANLSIDQVVIASGGTLKVKVLIILTLLNGAGTDLTNNGTFTLLDDGAFDGSKLNVSSGAIFLNAATLTFDNTLSQINFAASSTYQHAQDGGNIPRSNWNASSTCEVTGVTGTVPGQFDQAFGNLTWNSSGQTSTIILGFTGSSTSIAGNFTISDSGGFVLAFSTTAGTSLTISGNLVVTGTARFSLTTSVSTITANLNGAYQNTSTGKCFLASSGTGVLNVKGNFTQSDAAGILQGTATSQVNFKGTTAQTFTGGGTFTNVNFAINNGSTLNMGTSALTGSGTFNLNAGGTLGVGSPDGLVSVSTSTSLGNICVTGPRTYSASGNIIYNGSVAQNLGDEWGSSGALNGIAVNLEIANTNSAGVTNDIIGSTSLVGNLTLTSNPLNIGNSNTLTIQKNLTVTGGTIGGQSTSNLVFAGSGTITGNLTFAGGSQNINDFTISRNATVVLGSSLTVSGNIDLSGASATLDFSGQTLTMNGGSITTSSGGLKSSSTSNLIFGGSTFSGSVPFIGSGNQLNNLTLATSSPGAYTWNSSVTINGNVSLASGALTHTSGLTMASNSTFVKGSGTLTGGSVSPVAVTSYNVVYNGTGNTGVELPSSSTALNNLTVSSSGTITLTSGITINGILTLSGGTFDAQSNSINLKGNFVSNSSSTLTSSAFTFSGTTTLSGSFTPIFGAITISGTLTPSSNFQLNGNLVNNGTLNSGSGTTTFGGTTTISGSSTSSFNNITVSGTLTAPSGTMNVAGNFTNNGSFDHNSGSVTFNGTTIISGSSTTSLSGVTISGTLTAPSGTLNIAGNWSTTGTFNHNSGKVVLNGTVSSQSITGTINVNDVDVSNTTGVFNNGTVNLTGILTLTSASAIFDADGATTGTAGSGVLTVKSTSVVVQANTGGRIAALPTPTNFFGSVTIERFVSGTNSWTYFSMPVTNGNVGMWKTSFPVTGNFSDPSPVGGNVQHSDGPSVYYWDATLSTPAWAAVGSGLSTSSTALSNTVGYSVFSYTNGSFTISTRGTIGKGTVPYPLGTTGSGLNLISNPYPSPIDWDNVTLPGSLSSYMSITNASGTNPVYSTYLHGAGPGTGTNAPYAAWSGEVATGQSFWVSSTGATSLSLTESSKTSNKNQFLRTAAPGNLMRIALISGSQKDESIIWFNSDATDSVDNEFDAPKRRNGVNPDGKIISSYVNISSYNKSSNTDFAINGVAPFACSKSIRLKVEDLSAVNNKLLFTQLDTFDAGYFIYLIDHYLNKQVMITDSLEYTFSVTSDPKSLGVERFEVQFSLVAKPVIQVSGITLTSSVLTGNQWLLNGVPITGATQSQYQVTQSGIYSVQASNGTCSITSEDVVFSITGVEGLLSEGIKASPNPVKDKLTVELINGFDSINVYDNQGRLIESISSSSATNQNSVEINFSSYPKGMYLLRAFSKAGNFSIKVIKE